MEDNEVDGSEVHQADQEKELSQQKMKGLNTQTVRVKHMSDGSEGSLHKEDKQTQTQSETHQLEILLKQLEDLKEKVQLHKSQNQSIENTVKS